MTDPQPPASPRRSARAAAERRVAAEAAASPRHARRVRARLRGVFAVAATAVLVVTGAIGVATATAGPEIADSADTPADVPSEPAIAAEVVPMPPEGLPVPEMSAQPAGSALCTDSNFIAALESGDDEAAIEAAGGSAAFRTAVATGTAPCVRVDDPDRLWVVVNKHRPYDPIDYRPGDLVMPDVRSLQDSALREAAAAALTEMVRAASVAGAGEIGSASAFRSYATQQATYAGHVADRGVAGADLVSARPGFSEHQSGITVDVVPCAVSCATIDDLATSPQGAWIRDHAWEFGWIVRYQEGRTDVTGYVPEPWHLRYIGLALAGAYHDGGWSTLEEFFGLPAAPGYAQ